MMSHNNAEGIIEQPLEQLWTAFPAAIFLGENKGQSQAEGPFQDGFFIIIPGEGYFT